MNFLKSASITTKVWMLVLIAVVIMLASGLWNALQSRDDFLAERKMKTRHLVEAAHTVLNHYYGLQQSGALDEKAAQEAAMKAVRAMRYDQKEYFWIHDLTAPVPRMIMHATVPALEGKILDDAKFNSATSIQAGIDGAIEKVEKKNLFVSFNVAVNQRGQGFVTYDWPKPLAGGGTSTELFEKLSYIKKFDHWNWVIGSGIYIDDLDKRVMEEVKSEIIRAVIVSILLLIVSSLMARSITGPLVETASRMVDIADKDGDLTQRIPEEGGKEIRALANGFNRFAAKIETIMIQVSAASVDTTRATDQLNAIISRTTENVARQREETENVSTSTNSLANAITEVANAAIQTAEAARKADQQTSEGKAVVDKTMAGINQMAKSVISATTVIERLAEDSNNIAGILAVIKGIADQTNLLALNAAIEAARAGEQGRGFAVVADEVRKLAQQSQQATEQIHRIIQTLKANAGEAVVAMKTSRELAQGSIAEAARTTESLESISSSVSYILQANEKNAANAEQQAAETEEIKAAIDGVNEAASITTQLAEDTRQVTHNVSDLVARLQGLVKQFKVSA
jgi:methyl-accepting chemotaxis protein